MSVFGADRILFSVDYPFSDNLEAANAITNASISDIDRKKISSGNAQRILKLGDERGLVPRQATFAPPRTVFPGGWLWQAAGLRRLVAATIRLPARWRDRWWD